MADVREKVEQIRQAIYGIEVRESIASGIEAINTEVESTTQRQTTLETDMAEAKREAEEAATRANTAAGDAEDITEAMAVWEEYDPEKDYVPLNKTTYQGSSYINVLACKGVPPTEETHWLPIASKGDKGEPGPTPTIIVGDTTTLSPGSAASVTRRADSPDAAPVLDFGIPRGVDGTGSGDMSKAIYDDNDDGKVNAADIADAVPTGAITDDMLSNDPNHIKARLSSHEADNAKQILTVSVDKFDNLVIDKGLATEDWKDAIAAAHLALGDNAGKIIFGSGTYRYTQFPTLKYCQNVEGIGLSTVLKPVNTNGINIEKYCAYFGYIKNLKIDGSEAVDYDGVYAPYLRSGILDNLWIINFTNGSGICFTDGLTTEYYCGYITINNPNIRGCKVGIEFNPIDATITQYTVATEPADATLVSQIAIRGSGSINANGIGIHLVYGKNITIDGIDLSANTVVGAFFGKQCLAVTLKNAWHELGSADDIVIHKDAEVTIQDTRPYSHLTGDSGIRRDSRSRANILSRSAILAEGNGFIGQFNAIVNGRFQEWDVDQPKYWLCSGKNVNYKLTQIKDADYPNVSPILNVETISSGGRILFPIFVHANDVGEVLTFSFDYRCIGDPTGLTDGDQMFNYSIAAIAANSSDSAVTGAKQNAFMARFSDTWQRVSFSVKIPAEGRYAGLIKFNLNIGQSAVDFQFRDAVITRGYFASAWLPSRLEIASLKHDIYYEEKFYGTFPSTNTDVLITPSENIGSIVSSVVIVSGKAVTTKPVVARVNRLQVKITPNDAIDADYILILRYLPETWVNGGFATVVTDGVKQPYFL